MNYKIHVNAMVSDETTGFKAGIDISVENGGDFTAVGNALQTAIETVSPAKGVEPSEQ